LWSSVRPQRERSHSHLLLIDMTCDLLGFSRCLMGYLGMICSTVSSEQKSFMLQERVLTTQWRTLTISSCAGEPGTSASFSVSCWDSHSTMSVWACSTCTGGAVFKYGQAWQDVPHHNSVSTGTRRAEEALGGHPGNGSRLVLVLQLCQICQINIPAVDDSETSLIMDAH